MKDVVHEQEVPLTEAPLKEGHHGGKIRYIFTKDTVGSRRLRLLIQEYPPGSYTVAEEHGVHPTMEQAYYILEGEMELELGQERRRIGPGTCVYIRTGTRHAHRNPGSTTLRFLTFNCRWEDQ
jgi:mannose-6-phosphate isomerase-like protein (cupin superfamily)